MSPDAPLPKPRRVRCPNCGAQTLYGAENPDRPFCSARCRSADLGAWASEDYRLASRGAPDDGPTDTAAKPAH